MSDIKIAEAFVEIKGDKGKLSNTLKAAKRETSGFAASAIKALKGVSIGLAAVGVAAASAATVISIKLTKSIVDLTKSAATFGDQLDKMSLRTGESVSTLSALSFAAEISGSTLQDLESGIRRLSRNMNDTARGIGEAKRSFEQMGISVKDSQGNLRAASDILPEIADKMRELGSESEKTAVAQELFGRGGASLLPLLKEGSAGMKRLTDQAADLGLVIDDKAAKAAAAFNDRMTEMNSVIKMVKVNIGNALMPVLTPLVEAFRDIGAVASKSVAQLTNAITEAGGLVKFWELYGDLVRATFEDMVIVGVRFTGELLKSMITLISAAGRVMWKPIVAGFKVAMVELIQATLPGISVIDAQIKILEKIPGIGDDIAKAWKKVKSPLDNFADSIKDGIIAGGIEETLTALKNETNNLTTAFKDLSGAGGTAVDDIVAAFDKLLANLPKIEEGAKKVKTTINNITDTSATSGLGLVASALADIRAEIEAFGDPSLESSVRRTVDALNELQTPDERLKARLKAIDDEEKAENERIGAMNARQDALAAKEIENIGNIKDTRERATISMLKMSKRKWTQHIGRLSAAWREFTIDLQVSFTDTFADMLSKGEASWETFAKSIKKIVIRHLSEIVVSAAFRALTDLFTISGFNGFATQQPAGSQDATSKFFEDVGEATSEAGRDDRKAPGTVISFPNADIRHMTQAQIEQVVQSQIQPAIRNLQKRGIIPSRI